MPFIRVESPETGHHFDVSADFVEAFPGKYSIVDPTTVDEPRAPTYPKRSSEPDPAVEPPREGKGSGDAKWLAHAQFLGIDVPEGAKKAQIIELVDGRAAVTVPTPPAPAPAAPSSVETDNTDQKES